MLKSRPDIPGGRRKVNPPMLIIKPIASGSSGNCMYVEINGFRLLIDAGIPAKHIGAGLAEAGVTPAELDAVIITHTHSDHVGGLAVLEKKICCPVYLSELSCAKLYSPEKRVLVPGRREEIGGGVFVTAFETSHDCPGSLGFRLDSGGVSLGYATDLGFVPEEMRELFKGAGHIVIESNHDEEMLKNGPYPFKLKRRILSDAGHLSNRACGEAMAYFAENGTADCRAVVDGECRNNRRQRIKC